MRLNSWFRAVLLASTFFSLTACSYLTSLFPDKQKQYRYSTELPDLEIPPDLSTGGAEGKEAASPSKATRRQDVQSTASVDKTEAAARPRATPAESASRPATKKRKPVKHNDSSVTLAESMENVAMIEMQEPYDEAWNDVSRALGRLKIEITDQNRSDGMYYVYYGGEKPKKPEEMSLWEDVVSIFSSEKDMAKEYRIKLDEKDEVTYIRILDQNEHAVSEGPGLDLLKRLHRKLMTLDQTEPEGEETKQSEEAEKK